MNDTLKTIAARYSCRAYQSKPISDEDLKAIADAAIAAPSAVNRQGWRVIVVKNKGLMDEMEAEGMRIITAMEDKASYNKIMARGGTVFYNAPCMIMVPIDSESKQISLLDCGILCENVALAATSLGLGSLICGMAGMPISGPKGDYFREKFAFPEGYEFGIAVLLGYPAKETAPHKPDSSKITFIN